MAKKVTAFCVCSLMFCSATVCAAEGNRTTPLSKIMGSSAVSALQLSNCPCGGEDEDDCSCISEEEKILGCGCDGRKKKKHN